MMHWEFVAAVEGWNEAHSVSGPRKPTPPPPPTDEQEAALKAFFGKA